MYATPSTTSSKDKESYDILYNLPPPISLEVLANTTSVIDYDSYDYNNNRVDLTN